MNANLQRHSVRKPFSVSLHFIFSLNFCTSVWYVSKSVIFYQVGFQVCQTIQPSVRYLCLSLFPFSLSVFVGLPLSLSVTSYFSLTPYLSMYLSVAISHPLSSFPALLSIIEALKCAVGRKQEVVIVLWAAGRWIRLRWLRTLRVRDGQACVCVCVYVCLCVCV